jgi:hypothetical protein
MLSYRLFDEADTMGALNLYSGEERAFDDDAVAFGAVFASHAALSSARHDQCLNDALRSRDLIGQAKGIVMSTHQVTADVALDLLQDAAQRSDRRLLDVVDDVTRTGALPEPELHSR